MHSDRAPFFLKLAAWGGVVFLHFPILIIAAYAFNTEDAAFSFPPQGLTLRWFSVAAQRSDILDSVTLSLKVAALATLIALVLGRWLLPRCGDETFSVKTPFRCYCCCPLRCRALSLVWRY